MRTAEERVLDYLQTHKTPVTANKLAKHFIMSESHTKKVLNNLVSRGIVQIVANVKPALYRLK